MIPLCQTKWHSWQRKEQAESRQRVKWPRDANNLGDWGRPALINAGRPCWLSGVRHRGTVLGFSPSVVLVTTTPIKTPREECSPPLTPASTPCMIMRGMFARGRDWPKLCQPDASLLTPHHHYCHLTLIPRHRWFSVLLLESHTLNTYCEASATISIPFGIE